MWSIDSDNMVDYTYDVDGNPVRRVQDCYEDAFCDYEDLVNPFVLKGDGFDVTLSMARGMLSWTSVSPKGILMTRPGGYPIGNCFIHGPPLLNNTGIVL